MATCVSGGRWEERTVTKVEKVFVPTYTLTLTEDEAKALREVMTRIGGVVLTTRRGRTDNIGAALEAAGVRFNYLTLDPNVSGSITFTS